MKHKRVFTKEKLLNKAISLGLEIKQNTFGKWIIRNTKDNRWLMEEQGLDKWLITCNKASGIIVKTELGLKLLNLLTKKDLLK